MEHRNAQTHINKFFKLTKNNTQEKFGISKKLKNKIKISPKSEIKDCIRKDNEVRNAQKEKSKKPLSLNLQRKTLKNTKIIEKGKSSKVLKLSGKRALEIYKRNKYRNKLRRLLPLKFELLLEFFKAAENVMVLHFCKGRKTVEFKELKKSVQLQTKRDFKLIDLRRIIRVLPEAYLLQSLRIKERIDGWRCIQRLIVQLIHKFNNKSDRDIKERMFYFDGNIREKREKIFRGRLEAIVDKAHKTFIAENRLPEINTASHNEWSVGFDLDGVTLPEPITVPEIGTKTPLKKSDSFRSSETKFDVNKEGLVSEELMILINRKSPSDKKPSTILPGISAEIVDKIRRRSKLVNIINVNKEHRKEIELLDEIEKTVKIVHQIFITSHKTKMPISQLVQKLTSKMKRKDCVLNNFINAQLDYLLKLETKWCKRSGRSNNIFQIDRKVLVKCVFEGIAEKRKNIKNEIAAAN